MTPDQTRIRQGLLYGVVAYLSWGLIPLYFKAVMGDVDLKELIAHRIVWSCAFLVVLLTAARRWRDIRIALANRRTVLLLFGSSVTLLCNWYGYVYSVYTNRLLESSLGYYMLPLANVLFGMVFFGERLRPLQGIALSIAAFGIGRMVWEFGEIPWLGLFLTVSFGFYGVLRKIAPVDGVVGFSIETFLLVPFAALFLLALNLEGSMRFLHPPSRADIGIVFSGVVTAIPLVCFAQAVRRVGLIAIGFIQYLSPTTQMLIAIFVFGEEFGPSKMFSFAFVWVGLLIFVVDTGRMLREKPKRPPAVGSDR